MLIVLRYTLVHVRPISTLGVHVRVIGSLWFMLGLSVHSSDEMRECRLMLVHHMHHCQLHLCSKPFK